MFELFLRFFRVIVGYTHETFQKILKIETYQSFFFFFKYTNTETGRYIFYIFFFSKAFEDSDFHAENYFLVANRILINFLAP